MLIQFVVENFRSFRARTVLSMRAPEDMPDKPGLVVEAGGERILRAAVLYGANASGKSNVVKAMQFAQSLIREGTANKQSIPRQPFKLDPAGTERPSRFEWAFVEQGIQYAYGFLVDSERVIGEWLFRGADSAEELVFARQVDRATRKYSFEVGTSFITESQRRQFYEFVHEGTRPNQLFLCEAKERNVTELEPVHAWFSRLAVLFPDTTFTPLMNAIEKDPDFAKEMGRLLQRFDTGVRSIRTRITKAPPEVNELARQLGIPAERSRQSVLMRSGLRPESARIDDRGDFEHIRLVTEHTTPGEPVEFELDEESDGTMRLLHLAPVRYVPDGVFVIDEIDRSLHPLLTRVFLREFLSKPGTNSQLICTTHDTHLLEGDLLGPESIWFTEKDQDGATHLYSLLDFDAGQLEVLQDGKQEGYLQGRFGAIPYLGDASRLPRKNTGEGGDGDGHED